MSKFLTESEIELALDPKSYLGMSREFSSDRGSSEDRLPNGRVVACNHVRFRR